MVKSKRSGKKMRRMRSRKYRGGTYSLANAAPVLTTKPDVQVGPGLTKSDDQGKDFASYHEAQHGGSAPLTHAFDTLDPNLRGSAMMNGLDKAIARSALEHDDTMASVRADSADQSGGKRRRRVMKRKTQKRRSQKRRGQKKSQRKRRSQRGGLGMPPLGSQLVDANPKLLDSMEMYSHAGLNPDYYKGTSTEQWAADARDRY
jgi:hypothetical protein